MKINNFELFLVMSVFTLLGIMICFTIMEGYFEDDYYNLKEKCNGKVEVIEVDESLDIVCNPE